MQSIYGKYPIIFLSLKNVEGISFEAAKYQMIELISKEAERFGFLSESGTMDIILEMQMYIVHGMLSTM